MIPRSELSAAAALIFVLLAAGVPHVSASPSYGPYIPEGPQDGPYFDGNWKGFEDFFNSMFNGNRYNQAPGYGRGTAVATGERYGLAEAGSQGLRTAQVRGKGSPLGGGSGKRYDGKGGNRNGKGGNRNGKGGGGSNRKDRTFAFGSKPNKAHADGKRTSVYSNSGASVSSGSGGSVASGVGSGRARSGGHRASASSNSYASAGSGSGGYYASGFSSSEAEARGSGASASANSQVFASGDGLPYSTPYQ